MAEKFDVQIRFTVYSDADLAPRKVEEILGIKASRTAEIGSRSTAPKVVPVANLCTFISAPTVSDASLSDHWENFFGNIMGKEKILTELKTRSRFRMTVVVDARQRAPAIIIPIGMCDFCSRYQIEIDVDIDQK